MKEILCPDTLDKKELDTFYCFVAGGISNCPYWQKELTELLSDVDNLVLVNPRRANFDTNDLHLEEEQIKWEHDHLSKVDGFMFWFPCETLCPITLFELGKVAGHHSVKPIFVGTHPDYQRKRDIRWQMLLLRPEVDVVHSIEAVANQIREWCRY